MWETNSCHIFRDRHARWQPPLSLHAQPVKLAQPLCFGSVLKTATTHTSAGCKMWRALRYKMRGASYYKRVLYVSSGGVIPFKNHVMWLGGVSGYFSNSAGVNVTLLSFVGANTPLLSNKCGAWMLETRLCRRFGVKQAERTQRVAISPACKPPTPHVLLLHM